MDWSDIAGFIGSAAPLLGGVLAGPAGAAAGRLVASALGVEDKPAALAAALKADPQALIKLKQIEQEHVRELRRMTIEAETARLTQINVTMRVEAGAQDAYVRRWRPTFGYVAAGSWLLQIAATAYAVVVSPGNAAAIIQAVTSLTPMWGIALAVLGVSIQQRSRDKEVAAGREPAGLIQAIASRISGPRAP
ncbi:MAG: holin family protein [Nitrococcus sp.]|nr:holin family protein [Nitrococcus sp.]